MTGTTGTTGTIGTIGIAKASKPIALAVIASLALLGGASRATADTTTTTTTTNLGGWQASAYAAVVHVQVYEPILPIPTSPQGDVSIGYTKSTSTTGPTTRATASYLWPGDTLGDGFGTVIGMPSTQYPIQVNSRFPSGPASQNADLTTGSVMDSSTNGESTAAAVTVAAVQPPTSLLGQLLGGLSGPSATTAPVPVPVPAALSSLISVQNVTSTAKVTVGANAVTSVAHAGATDIALLGGLISLGTVDVDSTVTSDGTKATVTGGSSLGGLTVAGVKFALDEKGIDFAGSSTALPALTGTLSTLLSSLGISFSVLPTTKTVNGANGELTAQALIITIDTAPILSQIQNPLSSIVSLLGASTVAQLAPVLTLQPKIVFTIGDVDASSAASPAFVSSATAPSSTPTMGSATTPLGGGLTNLGSSGGGTTTYTAGTPGTSAVQAATPAGTLPTASGSGPAIRTVAASYPAMGAIPRSLVIGALLLAVLLGLALRGAGGLLFGGARKCGFGLVSGVPDLRKG